MKKIAVLSIGILAVVIFLSFAKDTIIKISVIKAVRMITGLQPSIGTFRIGILNPVLDIKDLELSNPPGFKEKRMFEMPEIYVKYDLPSIFKNKIHLPVLRIALTEFIVVKNSSGALNLNSLKVVKAQKEGKKPGTGEKERAPQIQIDSLELKIGRVVYKDYSKGPEPTIKEFNINLDEKYSNIQDLYSLVSVIVVKSMTNTTIAGLANFDLQGLKGTVSGTLETAQKAAMQAVKRVSDAVDVAHQSVQTTTGTAKKAGEVVKTTTDALKDVFKNPFGSDE